MGPMDHAQHDADLTTLIDLHDQRRRLDIQIAGRKRRGRPTQELEELLAINRSKASHFALLLRLHSEGERPLDVDQTKPAA